MSTVHNCSRAGGAAAAVAALICLFSVSSAVHSKEYAPTAIEVTHVVRVAKWWDWMDEEPDPTPPPVPVPLPEPPSVPIPLPDMEPIEAMPIDTVCSTHSRPISAANGGGYAEYRVCCAGDGVCVPECGADYPADPGVPPVGCGG